MAKFIKIRANGIDNYVNVEHIIVVEIKAGGALIWVAGTINQNSLILQTNLSGNQVDDLMNQLK